jgi:hypothetical protein
MAIAAGCICGVIGLLSEQISCAPEPRSDGKREYLKGPGTIEAHMAILMGTGKLLTSAHCGIVHSAGEERCPV